jgi:competence protein ComFB
MQISLAEILEIVAFIPAYRDGAGQGLNVYYRDGTMRWLARSLKGFIQQLARFFNVNLTELKKNFGPLLGQVNLFPLALGPFLLFIPLKIRKPRLPGDPAYGYFKLRSLLHVSTGPAPCTVTLEGGHTLTLCQSRRAVGSRLRLARRLEVLLLEQHCRIIGGSAGFFVPQQALAAAAWQEIPWRQGIKAANGLKEGNVLELNNLMEKIVEQRLEEMLARNQSGLCRCSQCRLDVTALALNSLPPRYVVTDRGAAYAKANNLEIQLYVDVVAAVTKALQVVQRNPRHMSKE